MKNRLSLALIFALAVVATTTALAKPPPPKWWTEENERYRFMTDLSPSKGKAFITRAMRLAEAMRRSYEFYVPPLKPVKLSTVKVFKALSEYREYRAASGDVDSTSIGLWDPNREELLISAEGEREDALSIMRHEAFHQYLFYATGRGDHALWFNEGHACFFESVEYNSAKNTVKVVDKGNRAEWVERDPKRVASAIKSVLKMDRAAYYGGSSDAVNLHYVTGWAIVYFLQNGAYAHERFAPYRKVVPKYLELMAAGCDAREATEQAWALVADRDIEADFLRFWEQYRKLSRNARLKEQQKQ